MITHTQSSQRLDHSRLTFSLSFSKKNEYTDFTDFGGKITVPIEAGPEDPTAFC